MLPEEKLYSDLLEKFEHLIDEEATVINGDELDKLPNIESQKDRIVEDLVDLGKRFKKSPLEIADFNDRLDRIFEKQKSNLDLIKYTVDSYADRRDKLNMDKRKFKALQGAYMQEKYTKVPKGYQA